MNGSARFMAWAGLFIGPLMAAGYTTAGIESGLFANVSAFLALVSLVIIVVPLLITLFSFDYKVAPRAIVGLIFAIASIVTLIVVGALASKPTMHGYPITISGNPTAGSALIASNDWMRADHVSFQWLRCRGTSCQRIVGATSQAYPIHRFDCGWSLRVAERAQNGYGHRREFSPPTVAVGCPEIW